MPADASSRPTRERLLDAAVAALHELTAVELVTAVGTREIARRAGVSPTAFFHHFASVADFARELTAWIYAPTTSPVALTAARLDTVRGASLPVDTEYRFHTAEFIRLAAAPDLALRQAFAVFGGPAAAATYGRYLDAMEDRISPVFTELMESWGREPRPPFDVTALTALHMALVHGTVQRHRLSPNRIGADHFKRAAVVLNLVLLRLRGDRHTVDDRVSEMNYYPLRDVRTGREVTGQGAVTRARILTAAAELIGAHGFEQTTIASVARVARVSESTIYDLFTSKAGLAVALWVKQAQDMLAATDHSGLGPGPRLRAHLLDLARFTATHSDHAAPYLAGIVCHAPAVDDPVRDATRSVVAAAQRAGAVRSDLDGDDLADLLVSTVISRVLGVPSEGADEAAEWTLRALATTATTLD